MENRIGFTAEIPGTGRTERSVVTSEQRSAPVRSVVQVLFPERNMTLAYYNDRFDLRRGDIVYVEGKLEGLRGRVVDVSLTFKIKLSDYKRVIALADTDVRGEFHFAGSQFVTFDAGALPFEKVVTWFKAPEKENEEYAAGCDGSSFPLDDLSGMKADAQIVERGHEYFAENRVAYLSVDGTRGRAIVEGTRPYELEFEYSGGEISGLVCSCYCSGTCKHEVAVMLQLRETLKRIEQQYAGNFAASGCFAAISRTAFFSFVIAGKETGSVTV